MNTIYVSGEGTLTKEQLSRYSSSVARFLTCKNIHNAAILCGKSPLVISAIAGCLKAGVCYIPVDKTLPAERMEMILKNADIVLSDEMLKDIISTNAEYMAENISCTIPAYTIYTSGTTGKPKGITVTRKNVINFLDWFMKIPAIAQTRPKNVLNQALFSFDLSVADIYYSLKTGARLTVLEKELLSDFPLLFQRMRESDAELAVFTPAFAEMCLCDKSFDNSLLPQLKVIFFCGEVLKGTTAQKLFVRFPNTRIINAYGPTETTCAVTAIEITRDVTENPLPVGDLGHTAGEICLSEDKEIIITGDSVAAYCEGRGGFGEYMGKPCFYTGDIGHIENNLLYFDGRRDRQVKIMGCRTELSDVENNLLKIEGVKQAAVTDIKIGNNTALLAYVVAENDVSPQFIKAEMARLVPPYMIPRKIQLCDKIPVTSNGKTDRSAINDN